MNANFFTPIFSIILPCYNVEKYIDKCIETLINQDFIDFEIICINDGSKDDTLKKLKKFSMLDPRLSVYTQKNGGSGNARNNGFLMSRGQYIIFLDADDFYEKELLQTIFNEILKNPYDILVVGSDRYNEITKNFEEMNWSINWKNIPNFRPFSYRDIKKVLFKTFMWWGWDKAYKRSFIESNFLFHQEIECSNDLFFNLTSFLSADTITVIPDILVHHRIGNNNSVSNNRHKNPENILIALYAVKRFLLERKLFYELENEYLYYSANMLNWYFDSINSEGRTNLKNFYNHYFNHEFNFNKLFSYNEYGADIIYLKKNLNI